MHLVMDVRRRDTQYQGSLTRVSDQLRVPFSGVLELIAALECLTPEDKDGRDPSLRPTRESPERRIGAEDA